MQHRVNVRGQRKHHDTLRDMMAALSHVFFFYLSRGYWYPMGIGTGWQHYHTCFSSISRGTGTQRVYGGRLFVVSAHDGSIITRVFLLSLAGVPNGYMAVG